MFVVIIVIGTNYFSLWLNEGFASYMEYLGASHVEPDTGLQDRFALESMHNTFKQGFEKLEIDILLDLENSGFSIAELPIYVFLNPYINIKTYQCNPNFSSPHIG
jgi:hypothetical protein